MNRIIGITAFILRGVIQLFCIFVIILSMYACADIWHIYHQAEEASAARYKPEQVSEDADPSREALGNKAWLTIDNTSIDYPVMQGTDNNEYLYKDPYGNYSLSGSIFLDCRNKDDFSDDYILIYGHHMDGKLMFGSLDRYYDDEYFMLHQNGSLIVNGEKRKLKIFAMGEEDAMDAVLYSPGNVSAEEVLTRIRETALFFDETMHEGKRITALSTCRYYGYSHERTMVFAWLD